MELELRFQHIPDWTIGLLFLSLVLMSLSKIVYPQRHLSFSNLISHNKFVFVYNKKQAFIHPFQWCWGLFAVINCSLFLFFFVPIFLENSSVININYLTCFSLVSGFVVIKAILQNIHGWLFGNKKLLNEIVFKKNSFFNYGSMVLFTANILYAFIPFNAKLLFYSSLFLFVSITLIGWILILRNYQKYILHNVFYFILYLCALEIAPFLIIASIFNT
jgi:hypothetical protein